MHMLSGASWLLVSLAMGVWLADGALAAEPFAGTFVGKELTIEAKAADGQYSGVIKLGEQSFPFTAREQEGALVGK
ncbi:MAG: hypothetical protein FJ279_25195 [Planctomycetes bacterium]|nr:hypothetical protein [Planctomycetota bacterium]MBM4087624.1 hypothetical protein [Planctomycetota bacterium]